MKMSEEISGKISELYEYLIETFNEQNQETIRLQIELHKALNENNNMKQQINILLNQVLELEKINKDKK